MDDRPQGTGLRRLLREPLVHFFFLGALLFVAHRLVGDDSRHVVVGSGVRADLERRFRDEHGRLPDAAERAELLATWELEEALYREALRRDLHQNDSVIRGVLIDKMRQEAQASIPALVPSDAELERWLEAHRERYELPRRFDFQFFTFHPSRREDGDELRRIQSALAEGTPPQDLGRALKAGHLTEDDLPQRVGPVLARAIVASAPGSDWQRVEGDGVLWLLRLRRVSGGMPRLDEVRTRVLDDFTAQAGAQQVALELEKVRALYRFTGPRGEL